MKAGPQFTGSYKPQGDSFLTLLEGVAVSVVELYDSGKSWEQIALMMRSRIEKYRGIDKREVVPEGYTGIAMAVRKLGIPHGLSASTIKARIDRGDPTIEYKQINGRIYITVEEVERLNTIGKRDTRGRPLKNLITVESVKEDWSTGMYRKFNYKKEGE